MKYLFPLALLAAPAAAQNLPAVPKCSATNADCIERQADIYGARGDIYTARAAVEYALEDAKNAIVEKLRDPVVPPVVIHDHTSMLPKIDLTKIPAPAVGFSVARIRPQLSYLPVKSGDGVGAFRTVCQFSHMNFDDPIVVPGIQGGSHLHAFFGNTGVNYATTRESIEKTGNSTCSGGTANRTGYWVPAIIDTKDGSPVKPTQMMIYYKASYKVSGNITPFPAGLRMVAGDMRSTGPQEGVGWKCYNGTVDISSNTIPASCPVGATLEANIGFQICWDGKNLDSPNHKSHMADPVQLQQSPWTWSCPTTHPVLMPSMEQKVQYIVTEAGASARWRLSSDNYGTDKAGGYSLHADWFNGWDMAIQEAFVKNCLQASMDCHAFLLGDGREMF